jgi:hypothetical protein
MESNMLMNCLHARLFGRAAILVALVTAFPAAAQQAVVAPSDTAAERIQAREPDRAQLERRFESVGTLIEKSTAARQIEASGVPAARERHELAKQAYAQAKAAYAAGDLAKASTLLSSASKTVFEAARLAAPETVTAQKNEKDFRNKLESVKALLAAQKRIATEKSEVKGTSESARQIEGLLAEAEQKAAAGQIDSARTTLEQAYLLAKASVSSMRSGDTLVRSLNFASKEEEYHYEVDRNDTHLMLIKVLLDGATNPKMQEFLDASASLRREAEAAAARREFAVGVETLERATIELVKAIRSAGIYIPG